MGSSGAAFGAILLLAALLGGAGSLVYGARRARAAATEELTRRIVVGAAVVSMAWIALYELLRIPFHPATAAVLAVAGLARFAHARRTGHGPSDPGRAGRMHSVMLAVLALGTFWAVFKGALLFTSFEGRDGWGHALGAHYLLATGVPRQPFAERPIVHYVDGYPPLFDALLALLCGMAGSVNAPLKAMSALWAALAGPALYLMVHRLCADRSRAALAVALYAMLSGNLTRHVWSHSLALVFVLVGVAELPRRRGPLRWLPSALCFAGALLAAPTTGIKGGVLLVVAVLAALATGRRWALRLGLCGAAAALFASLWFGPALARYGTGIKRAMEQPRARWAGAPAPVPPTALQGQAAPPARRYNLDDFLFFRPYDLRPLWTEPKFSEAIVPIGLGVPVVLLCGASFAAGLGRRRSAAGTRLLRMWLAVAVCAALAPHFGIEFYTWRVWLLLVPLSCAVAADGLLALLRTRTRAAGLALAVVAAMAAVNAVAAARWDWSGTVPARAFWARGAAPGAAAPSAFLADLPAFAMLVAGAALLAALAVAGPPRPRRAAVSGAALILLAHLVIAAPVRLKVLAGFVQPLGYASTLEYHGYLALTRETRPGARVLALSGAERTEFVVGLDRECRPHERDELQIVQRAAQAEDPLPTAELLQWLRERRYEYLVLDPSHQRELSERGPSGRAVFARRMDELQRAPGLEVRVRAADGPGPQAERFLLVRVAPGAPVRSAAHSGRGTIIVSNVNPVEGSRATALPASWP